MMELRSLPPISLPGGWLAYDVRAGLGSVETPVLIIGGDDHPITTPQHHDMMQRSRTRAQVTRLRFASLASFR
jgi:hypothetical protein